MDHAASTNAFEIAFLGVQAINVLFLLLHDWVPLGRLSNLAAIRGEDTMQHRLTVTVLPVVPTAIALFYSVRFFGEPYPHWLWMLLWITYGILLLGLLRAWWIPYLVAPDPERAARYRMLFAGTHRFLPERNGMAPDTLHTLFHLNMVVMIALLLCGATPTSDGWGLTLLPDTNARHFPYTALEHCDENDRRHLEGTRPEVGMDLGCVHGFPVHSADGGTEPQSLAWDAGGVLYVPRDYVGLHSVHG